MIAREIAFDVGGREMFFKLLKTIHRPLMALLPALALWLAAAMGAHAQQPLSAFDAALQDAMRSNWWWRARDAYLYIPAQERARICVAFHTQPCRSDCLDWHADLLNGEEALAKDIEAAGLAPRVRAQRRLTMEMLSEEQHEAALLRDPVRALLMKHGAQLLRSRAPQGFQECGTQDDCALVFRFDDRLWLRDVQAVVRRRAR